MEVNTSFSTAFAVTFLILASCTASLCFLLFQNALFNSIRTWKCQGSSLLLVCTNLAVNIFDERSKRAQGATLHDINGVQIHNVSACSLPVRCQTTKKSETHVHQRDWNHWTQTSTPYCISRIVSRVWPKADDFFSATIRPLMA